MRKFIIVFLLVILMSGCHAQTFSTGGSQIDLNSELEGVIDDMMDKGNYDASTLVPYDRVSLSIDYSQNRVVVEAVQFQVYRRTRENEHQYDSTACFDDNGRLACKEERGKYTSSERTDEIRLIDAIDVYSKINVNLIVDELREHYSIRPLENMLIVAHHVKPEDIQDDIDRFDNIVYYYDDEFHFNDSTYHASEMMLEIVVHVFGEGEGQSYVVYFELE